MHALQVANKGKSSVTLLVRMIIAQSLTQSATSVEKCCLGMPLKSLTEIQVMALTICSTHQIKHLDYLKEPFLMNQAGGK